MSPLCSSHTTASSTAVECQHRLRLAPPRLPPPRMLHATRDSPLPHHFQWYVESNSIPALGQTYQTTRSLHAPDTVTSRRASSVWLRPYCEHSAGPIQQGTGKGARGSTGIDLNVSCGRWSVVSGYSPSGRRRRRPCCTVYASYILVYIFRSRDHARLS